MKKSKLVTIIAAALLILSCLAMFLPQIVATYTRNSVSATTTLSNEVVLLGGEAFNGETRLGVFQGSTLALLGYIFLGSTGIIFLATVVSNNNALNAGIKLLFFWLELVGFIFVCCTLLNFKYINGFETSALKSFNTYEAWHLGIGNILAIVLGSLSLLATLFGIGCDLSQKK